MAVFNGSEGGEIDLATAKALTQNYRDKQNDPDVVKAHFFGREVLERLLAQKDCVGARMYYGLDEEGKKQLILVGVDANGTDLEDGIILDKSSPCPPNCSVGSSLAG
ncbi:hypothetical protein FVR03_06920 [Pontibacter qinzhouensis]|uniref:Uncharacterized protein n=1 Tax=Pontibacter qinzhouensis TaxID=2603253 RepID=A0A5C8KAA3_9BACT|nr:hypothetical protein [Pontibacter qinzhouensis]TXK49109.1 hypothetical protein FVR03_06920 [Pontibacter qinzhouensis]